MKLLAVAGRELRALFVSPLAWVVLAVSQLLLAFFFLGRVEEFIAVQGGLAALDHAPGITELIVAPTYDNAVLLLLLIVPLLSMRLISGERRQQTLPLLLSAPISLGEIVVGKFLGLYAFLLLLLALITLLPLSLLVAGPLDLGRLFAMLLAMALLLAAFSAAGLYLSTLTAHPAAAAAGSFGLLLLLWMIDLASNDPVLAALSMQRHHQTLMQGLVDTTALAYYLLLTTLFLLLAIHRLDRERQR